MDDEDENRGSGHQLVVCCDGTNNTLTAGAADTNVLRLVTHLCRHPSAQRLLYYDPGVGSPDALPPTDPIDWVQRSWDRITGLASGRGVYDNIAQAYLFLMRHWRDERDRIYCFGFSRGAFTARCVAGMVNLFGVLRPEHEALLPTLIRVYFSLPAGSGGTLQKATRAVHHALTRELKAAAEIGGHTGGPVTRDSLARQICTLFTTPAGRDAWVHWVGVWDTVESVGLPGPLSRSNPSTATLRGKRIRHVRHALALDEHRWTFEPRLYEEPGDIGPGDPSGQTLRQRWFPGVHCDVGGSYPAAEAGLSDEALAWMVDEVAADLGVPPLPPPAHARRERHDALWETPWWALAGMCLRDMQPQTASGQAIAVVAASTGAEPAPSVWERRRALWPLAMALPAGAICLLLSGACLQEEGWRTLGSVDGLLAALQAARGFALDQLASMCGRGLLDGAQPLSMRTGQPGWAMAWDLGFIVCWGYLLARISSRAFASLAGTRTPMSRLPVWRALGMAPLAAVGSDVVEDLLTLAALATHAAGVGTLAAGCVWLAGVASLCKFAGLLACLPLLLVRLWLALPLRRQARAES